MKLKKLRVQNYKCIEDSNEIETDQVTYFVGKNEAGKSALLEALYKLNPVEKEEADFQEVEYPRRHVSTYRERKEKEPANVLTTQWKLEKEDRDSVSQVLGVDPIKGDVVTVTKGYDNKRVLSFTLDEPKLVGSLLDKSSLNDTEKAALQGIGVVEELLPKIQAIASRSESQNKFLTHLQQLFPDSQAVKAVAKILEKKLPLILYFKEYQKLPGRVSIDELKRRKEQKKLEFGDRLFMALLDLAHSSSDDIGNIQKSEQLIMELEAVQNRLTDEIFTYWTQNRHLEVQFRFDPGKQGDPVPYNTGQVFSTRIYNQRHRATVNFEERSTGFIWFFSFLVWFSQVKKNYGDNLLILLDEPGITLHGKAQKDLLRYINEKLRPLHQVLYTTHSPFMLDVENIFSLRTVEDVVEKVTVAGETTEKVHGTKVGQRILSRDRDTVLPLQGILGFDIAQTMFVGPYVLVIEGPAEAGYINWFTRRLVKEGRIGLDLRWAIAPAEGASKVTSFVTLFSGRGLKIATLLDYHEGQKGMVDKLDNSGLLPKGHLLKTTAYVKQDDADIEDVVGRPLFVSLVNRCLDLQSTHSIPLAKPSSAPIRVVKEAEEHCRTLPPGYPELDHYKPVECLLRLEEGEIAKLPGLDEAMKRFEKLFLDLNKLI